MHYQQKLTSFLVAHRANNWIVEHPLGRHDEPDPHEFCAADMVSAAFTHPKLPEFAHVTAMTRFVRAYRVQAPRAWWGDDPVLGARRSEWDETTRRAPPGAGLVYLSKSEKRLNAHILPKAPK